MIYLLPPPPTTPHTPQSLTCPPGTHASGTLNGLTANYRANALFVEHSYCPVCALGKFTNATNNAFTCNNNTCPGGTYYTGTTTKQQCGTCGEGAVSSSVGNTECTSIACTKR